MNSIVGYLEKSAEKYPTKVALSDEKTKMTYSEYRENARKIGSFLINKGIGIKKPIAVLIDRNINTIIAFLGVAYSGNFYVPLDCSMPMERIELILNTLKPVLVLDAREDEKTFLNMISVASVLSAQDRISEKVDDVAQSIIDTDPLYAIFTSGSTGVPKGVLVSHRSVIDLVENFSGEFQFDDKLIFGNQAPFDFDVSVKDIYNSLLNGASLEVIPKRLFMMPVKLLQYLKERKVNTLIWAVSALRIVSDFNTFSKETISGLRYIMFSGECMPAKALNYWIKYVPKARYINLYGPTEITCNCTYFEIKGFQEETKALPIGKPFSNTRIMLLNEKNQNICEPNMTGEICVEGSSLALGYWNNEEKTGEVFVQEPGNDMYPNKIYRTGDLGYYNEDGNLVFSSRKDFQIKHMGHRIELGEIEVALNAISFINVACCIYDEEHAKIVCIYQSEKEDTKGIVEELGKKLPKYMWPNIYHWQKNLPLNKNGKIDRTLLKEQIKNNLLF